MDSESISIDSIAAKAGAENFPVALAVLPKKYRRQLKEFYNFARLVDDLGDEYEGDRLEALDWAEKQLTSPSHPLFLRLDSALGDIDRSPLVKLIDANRLDQKKNRYKDYGELYEYCELSANPVGHVVLSIFGVDSLMLYEYSDSVCTGLQILEHLQDINEDYKNGRIYLPQTEMKKFDVGEGDLKKNYATPELRKLVIHNLKKVRQLLSVGAPLVSEIESGWGRLAVSGYIAGGQSAVDALLFVKGDIFHKSARKSQTHRMLYYLLKLAMSRSSRK